MLFVCILRGLCDITNQGRLNSEQFALAMYLIHQKVMGVDPPQTLSPEMVPPSMRSGGAVTPAGGEERVRFFFLQSFLNIVFPFSLNLSKVPSYIIVENRKWLIYVNSGPF